MRKLRFYLFSACMLLLIFPTEMKAEKEKNILLKVASNIVESTKADTVSATNNPEINQSQVQKARLEEIDGIDMSKVSRSQKKELQQEVSSIQKDQNRFNEQGVDKDKKGGIILSIGGGLLIILLLLIFRIK